MIDIDAFLSDIHSPMAEYTDAEQVLQGNQKIPDDLLEDNRIIYTMIAFSDSRPRHTAIRTEEVIDYDADYWEEGPEFEDDIEISYIVQPQATISFTAHGSKARKNISKLREWWYIPILAGRWFKENDWKCVVREVMSIDDRTVYLETNYEQRFGFDVLLEFTDIVSAREKTIETIEIEGDIEKTIKLSEMKE